MQLPKNVRFLLSALLLFAAACSRDKSEPPPAGGGPVAAVAPPPAPAQRQDSPPAGGERVPAATRRIVKKATLEIEVASPSDAQTKATRIVETAGGYVANSQRGNSQAEGRVQSSASLTLRVPAERFSTVLAELRRLGTGAGVEQIGTEDMTEEFVDLDARIKNQRMLEERFLELLKTAAKVPDALQIEREIAGVRTEIERMQGRQRLLERETEFSTITLSIAVEEPLVSASFADFRHSVAHAYADALDLGTGIITASIRLLGVLVPIALLLGVPFSVGFRLLHKRRRSAAVV